MFNCLPGAMLQKGHTHQWKKGFSCSRVPPQHNAWMTASHRLFNPGPPGGRAPIQLRKPPLQPKHVGHLQTRCARWYFPSELR